MTITEALEKILGSRYGRDVRQAIHDGIKQAYEDAIKNGNANMEVSQARGKYPTLAERLNETTAQLAHKASKQEVEVERQRINTITRLAEGSTTADAELIDIRIGADGTVYETAGEAVRNVLAAYMTTQGQEWNI